MNKLRQTYLSTSALLSAHSNGRGYYQSYLFVKQLAAQSKHPIILDYKKQLNSIAELLGVSVSTVRRKLQLANHFGLVYKEGNNLRLWSKNKDKQFLKKTERNDYLPTSNPKKHGVLVLLKNHYSKQYASFIKKNSQTHIGISNSVGVYNKNIANSNITASIRSIANLLHTKDLRTAITTLKQLEKEGLVEISERKEAISVRECKKLLLEGVFNIRKIDGVVYRVYWDFKPLYKLTKPKKETFDFWTKLSEREQMCYEDMGYTRYSYNLLMYTK